MGQHRFWAQPTPIGEITVVVGPAGVQSIRFADQVAAPDDTDVIDVIDAEPERDGAVARQLDDWFAGRRHAFDLALDLGRVSGFRLLVLETLLEEVGWGETITYGELAEMAGSPGAARAVGSVMKSNPIPFVIPCHRVIASGGRIGGYGGSADVRSPSLDIKRTLLAREGVTVRG